MSINESIDDGGLDDPILANRAWDISVRTKKIVRVLLVLVILYAIARGVVGAATTPFLFDESLTQVVSSQPDLETLRKALADAVDSHPPFFYICERTVARFFSNKQIALRLLSVLAFPCTIICVFSYVRRRSGEIVGFLCAAILLGTSLFHIYGIDARAYSMVVACITFALVCYDRLPSLRWGVLFAFSLFLAESLHYYAIFSMVPFGVADGLLLLRTRQFRWPVWVSLAFATVPLIIFWPLLSNLRVYYGAHLWTHYSLSSIPSTYGLFFLTGGAIGGAVAVVSVAMVASPLGRVRSRDSRPVEIAKIDSSDAALILTMLSLPFVVYVTTKVLHGAMLDRYVLMAIVGVSLATGTVLRRSRGEIVGLFAVFVFSVVGFHEYSFWRSNWRRPFLLKSPAPAVENFVQRAGYVNLPVVISDGLNFMALAQYASSGFSHRITYLADEQKAVGYVGTDSIEKGLLALRPYSPLAVVQYQEFTRTDPQFLLYVEEPVNGFDWVAPHLTRTATLQLVAAEYNRRLFLATMTNPKSAN